MAVSIGLVGAGRWASEVHAPSLASCPGVRFAGIWGRSADAARELAAQHSVPAYGRYNELLDNCDAVAFAVPPAVQAELGAFAARRGKAVLLEKPIAGDIAGAEELAMAVAAKGVVSQVALTWRYSFAVRQFLSIEVLRTHPQGGSGRIISGVLAPGQPASPWRLERGALIDLGPHLVDLLDAVLGRVADVRAHGDPHGWIGLLLEHEGGRFSEASLYAGAAVGPHRAEVEIFGPGGAAAVDCAAAVGPDTFETMFREFAEAVEQGKPHELDVQHGLHLQRVIETAEADLRDTT